MMGLALDGFPQANAQETHAKRPPPGWISQRGPPSGDGLNQRPKFSIASAFFFQRLCFGFLENPLFVWGAAVFSQANERKTHAKKAASGTDFRGRPT